MSDYEKFQLQWMIHHGHSLRELMEEQEKVREQLEEKEERWMYLNELAEEFGL